MVHPPAILPRVEQPVDRAGSDLADLSRGRGDQRRHSVRQHADRRRDGAGDRDGPTDRCRLLGALAGSVRERAAVSGAVQAIGHDLADHGVRLRRAGLHGPASRRRDPVEMPLSFTSCSSGSTSSRRTAPTRRSRRLRSGRRSSCRPSPTTTTIPPAARRTSFPSASSPFPSNDRRHPDQVRSVRFLRRLQVAVHSSNTPALTPQQQRLSDAFDRRFGVRGRDLDRAGRRAFRRGAQTAHAAIMANYLATEVRTSGSTSPISASGATVSSTERRSPSSSSTATASAPPPTTRHSGTVEA